MAKTSKTDNMVVEKCDPNKMVDFVSFSEKVLNRDQIYAGVRPLHDRHTYGSKKELMKLVLRKYLSLDASENLKKRTIRIVEIGAYRGESANEMADACKELARIINCSIIAIDHWNGKEDEAFSASPESFQAFKQNVVFFNNTNIITPFRGTAVAAFDLFKCYKLRVDIVYFDFSTSYSDTNEQLDMYYTLMDRHGVFFGTSFCGPGVDRAVKEFAEWSSCELVDMRSTRECTWMLAKKI